MHTPRLILIFIFLLSGTIFSFAFSPDISQKDNKVSAQIYEDLQILSPSHPTVTVDFYTQRAYFKSYAIPVGENFRKYSREEAYYATHRFIKPGLSLPALIFPFHSFL